MSALDHTLVADVEFDALYVCCSSCLDQRPLTSLQYTSNDTESSSVIHSGTPEPPAESPRYPAKFHAKRITKYLPPDGIVYLRGTQSETFPDSDQERPVRQSR